MKILQNQHLHHLVQHIVGDYSPAASLRSNSIQNHIPEGLEIKANATAVWSVINEMLHAIVSNAQDSCIRISAKKYHNVILLHIKDSSSYNNYAVSAGLQRVQPMAEEMGGFLDITSQRQKETTIAFSFLNLCEAA